MNIINRKLFIILKILYLLVLIVFLVLTFISPEDAILGGPGLIQGGVIEAMLFLSSLTLIHNLKWKISFIAGILGCFIFGLDILFYRFISGLNYYSSYVMGGLDQLYFFSFVYLTCWGILLIVNILLLFTRPSKRIDNLKTQILDLSTKFTRLTIGSISEKLNKDPILVKNIINTMVENKEVYGEYFDITKTITFDQQANINEIDQLLSKFTESEDNQLHKKA